MNDSGSHSLRPGRERFNRRDFLDALFGVRGLKTPGFILIRTVRDRFSKPADQFFPNIDRLASEQFPADREVFFGVCPRESMKTDKEHIRFIAALWAGLDVGSAGYSGLTNHFHNLEAAMDAVKGFPLKPSIVVRSGRGLHLYWLLDSPKEIPNVESVEGLLRKINRYFRCNAELGVDSIMRLPGTLNPWAGDRPVLCYVEHLDSDLLYNPRAFQELELPVAPPIVGERKALAASAKQTESKLNGGLAAHPAAQAWAAPAGSATQTESMVDHSPALPAAADGKATPVAPSQTSGKETAVDEAPRGSTQTDDLRPVELSRETIDQLVELMAEKMAERHFPRLADQIADALVDKSLSLLLKRLGARDSSE
jgi:hypothetical protein